MLRRYYERKAFALEYLGGKCVTCDGTEKLQFHHKDRSTKIAAIGKMWAFKWQRFIEELDKCELQCKKCHKQIHAAVPIKASGALF